MIDQEETYSIPEIRRLLQTFDHAGLVALCQDLADEFPGLSRNVGLGRGLREDEIINMILDFFRRHDDFAPLVVAVEAQQTPQGMSGRLLQEGDDSTEDAVPPEPGPIWHRRLRDLDDSIARALDLLKQYEDALLYEDDPRRRARYLYEIEQVRESLTRYKREYDELEAQMAGEPSATMRDVAVKLRQMEDELEIRRQRQALLDRYKAEDQSTVAIPVGHLDQTQLADVQTVLDALEAYQLPMVEMRRTLNAIQGTLAALQQQNVSVPNQQVIADTLADPTLDMKHRLKLAIPIIPVLLSYEGEVELSSEMALLGGTWRQLRTMAGSHQRFLLANIIAMALGVAVTLLAGALQMDVFARLITASIFFLIVGALLWVGPRLLHVPAPRSFSYVKVALSAVIGVPIFFAWLAFLWTGMDWDTIRCGKAQVSSCLELDLATGAGQEICPDDNGVLILPPNSLRGLMNLSGRAILTPVRGCTCEWKGQAKEGQTLKKFHSLTQECSFSFELPAKPTTTYYLTLAVGEQHKLFIITFNSG